MMDKLMRQKRFPPVILALLSACALVIVVALAIPALAQPASDNSSRSTGMPPVTFILDNMLDSHEQDIKEKMFEYKFEAASNDPAGQAALVEERSDELKKNAASKKGFLLALMARNQLVSDEQFIALTDDVNSSIEKLNGWSRKLEEHAAGLAMLNGHKTYTDSVEPLISDINDAKDLASKAAKSAKDNNGNNGNGNSGNGNGNPDKK